MAETQMEVNVHLNRKITNLEDNLLRLTERLKELETRNFDQKLNLVDAQIQRLFLE
jgi:hypothetical protein